MNTSTLLFFFSVLILTTSCSGQTTRQEPIGGPCEGCEAVFEYGNKTLLPVDTLPEFASTEPKLMITGRVFQMDGQPAKDVILYIYHTDRQGIYATKGNEQDWGRRHGYIRGWVKTDSDGRYHFYTFRPASYPNRQIPAHIHITILEPGKNPYYIDDFLFTGDPHLTADEIRNRKNRGGSGVVDPLQKGNIWEIHRDIFLGRNIPGYE